jgi:succinyl-CoA synthetase beta subunit
MDLLEYQAKELFREVGIPVLPSECINDPRQIRQLKLPYPLVLKSQVRAVGRGRAGGIRFVENTIDAIAAARAIFSLSIGGEYPQVLLAEARYEAKQELFLAIILDYQLQHPVLLGSVSDDLMGEGANDRLKRVAIEEEFSPFYGRRLAIAMGLHQELIESVASVIAKMYHLFVTKDLNRIEINPLGINVRGKLMALDGKITVNDCALERHPDLLAFTASELSLPDRKGAIGAIEGRLCCTDASGEIGILCNGVGLGMAIWDLLLQEKGKPACCWVLGPQTGGTLLPTEDLVEAFEEGLGQLMANPQVKVILINILSGSAATERLAEAIADAFLTGQAFAPAEDSLAQPFPPLVLRLVGGNIETLQGKLAALPVYWTDNLEAAVTQAIALC